MWISNFVKVNIMSNNEYQTVGLYEHNANSYRKVKASFVAGE
jgi:hypothetical protein